MRRIIRTPGIRNGAKNKEKGKTMKNKNLHQAKSAKKDEFYTGLNDIEKEMKYYIKHFKNATILCNCNDSEHSNFFKYFASNFETFGLKKLIATHFDYETRAYKLEMTSPDTIVKTDLAENGDFRNDESIELLKEANIVATNPPFSLFREYIDLLFKYDKKFIILGHINAVTYKNVFPKIAAGKVWLGKSIHSGDREFQIPDTYYAHEKNLRMDKDGNKFVRVSGVRWFSNLDFIERHTDIPLFAKYNKAKYPKYDNSDAINVDKVKDIPFDYYGLMGVPITFLDKHNPEQFEIVSFRKGDDGQDLFYFANDGKKTKVQPYFRILIKRIRERR